jgi:hypothetical protein
MPATISRLFDHYGFALQAVRDLEAAGVPTADISIIASNADEWCGPYHGASKSVAFLGKVDRNRNGAEERAESAGAGLGAVVGGGAGLLAGLGLLAIPGLGPVVAAGWLGSAALGAVAGATAGSFIGGLTNAGISKEVAPLGAKGIRRGGALVIVQFADADRTKCEAILDRAAVNMRDRETACRKARWKEFDASAIPSTAD